MRSIITRVFATLAAVICLSAFGLHDAAAQPLQKSAIQVGLPGNTIATGQTFGYRLTYNCSSTSGPCLNAEVVDLLPPEVQYVSTVPASPTARVAAINVTPNFGGSGRTRVQFVMVSPLAAGNSGDLLINVRFPNGTTPDGTTATNTADGINLGATPGTFTTPPVTVTATATVQVTLTKTLLTTPANLDIPESYRLRIAVPNVNGALGFTAIGPVTDTLPPGTVFNGATPAADCQPGCVGTTPATVTWTAPCTVPLNPNGQCDITVNVTFPSATFPSGTNVTNMFTADGTPLGEPPQNLGIGTITHPVTTFVPAPGVAFSKNMASGTPNPPTLNQNFSYDIQVQNNGNVPLDNLVVIDTLPVEMQVLSVTTGVYTGLTNFAAGEGVRVSYEKNTALGVFTLWGSSPNTTTNTTLTAPPPGLGAGEYLTRIRWEYGAAAVGMNASTRPIITGRIINPDNAGGPVAIGDTIQNCAALSAVYTAGPTPVNLNTCRSFVLSGPFVQLNPAKENLSGAGPFNPGQAVNWRLRVRSASQSSDPVPLENLVATDLLPVDLQFVSWTFDDQGTGLPAPQVFDQIPNFAGTGRTLLRWRWNAGSGNLGVNQQVWVNISTTIRDGAPNGNLSNELTLENDAPGLGQRCTGTSRADALDFDGDGDTAEILCVGAGTIAVAPIAELASSKTVQGVCDGGFVGTSSGTLPGAQIDYLLRVQNTGTVPTQNFVLIDILPFVGDTGVRDTSPRGSQFEVSLVTPITPPAGTTIFYSTSGNPCRGEVGGPTTGCDPPNWSTVPPTPISAVRSFKIEFGARVISPFDFIEFSFPLTGPASLAAGQTAFNSFAYQGDRADGFGSLAAEPEKVGISLGVCPLVAVLGDFVWVDTNANGVQDDGATGINGVFTELRTPGVDGIPRNLDDVTVNVTTTQNDVLNNPGWYNFPNLDAGTYYVCFTPPPSYQATRRDQGANDALDSDVDPTTQCTDPVVLPAGGNIPTIDYGVVQTAALGDYVWFDDGDNVQDDPPAAGVNGVTVNLYADNGDNTCAPATDALVASTATADDVFGAPGFYQFTGLIPGTPYCVGFVRPSAATAFVTPNVGGDDTRDSDAVVATGLTPVVSLASGEFNRTIDAGLVNVAGTLALGDQVWRDTDNDGVYEPQNGEAGIDGVVLSLYRDVDGDGAPTAGEYLTQTTTFTAAGFAGRYRFDNLAAGNYIVLVEGDNFQNGNALFGLTTSTGNDPAPDPDNDVNGDDNGFQTGALQFARPVTLTAAGEPTSEDGNNNTNLTVDFGFIAAEPTFSDYGDAPDSGAGTAQSNYNTLATDNGPSHLLGVPNAPRLGACVDGDTGTAQNPGANADDFAGGSGTVGTCATLGDDEDGVVIPATLVRNTNATFTVTAGVSACTLNAWVDWDANGVFGDAGEQIATNLNVAPGPGTPITTLVPATATTPLYARFRCSTASGLAPTGPAPDGEVEDYRLAIAASDFGDAPATYATSGVGAAQHLIDPLTAIYLGSCVDFEADGQPSIGADGDDVNAGVDRVGLCFEDEDGFTFTNFPACTTATTSVTASAPGVVSAWFDWNVDGDFNDAGELAVTNLTVAAGSNAMNVPVPCGAVAGDTYARVRFSSTNVATPGGAVNNGEVEDYVVGVLGTDFGDAPSTFPVALAQNGARHTIDTNAAPLRMGQCVDAEADGAPTVGATGDDVAVGSSTEGTCAVGGDDEDGVAFNDTMAACAAVNVEVNVAATGPALLDAWLDFNRDGDWNDVGERIANALAVINGNNQVPVNVPCDVSTGAATARFRVSTAGSPTFTDPAADGEVEDHQVMLRGRDYGDLPAPYATTIAGSGASHVVFNEIRMGALIDEELDGAPSVTATGDDTAGTDDEDGVLPGELQLTAQTVPSIDVTVTNTIGSAANLCGFIDFNADGDFADPGETSAPTVVANGTTGAIATVVFGVVPADAAAATYARFRINTTFNTPGCAPNGQEDDGEVEDYTVTITRYDLGDLPDTGAGIGANNYETLLANTGPRHVIVDDLRFGAGVDPDADGQPNATATGDDTTGPLADDEDGVTFQAGGYPLGSPARVTVNVTNTLANPATVCGFIDWNLDGDFTDESETATLSVPAGTSAAPFTLNFGLTPEDAQLSVFGRFRVSTAAGCTATGDRPDGEVEDYAIDTTGTGELTLGNLVWEDRNNNGLADAGEPGVAAVTVNLYADEDQNCVADGAALATTTTDANGLYSFTNLLPGFYQVEIAAPVPYVGSTGTGRWAATGPYEPAPDPDNDVNNDDNGTGTSGTIRSCAVELRAETKPVDDGDADFNTNLSVDFGLVFNFDLALRKTLADGQQAYVMPGTTVAFTITVYNQGTVPATNVLITDTIPAGMVLNDPAWTAGPAGTAQITIPGPIAPGASATVDIHLRISNNTQAVFTNMAEITQAQDDVGIIRIDRDSTPDDDDDNDGPPVDDNIENENGDEDDADFAVVGQILSIPANATWALLLMVLAMGWFARKRLRATR